MSQLTSDFEKAKKYRKKGERTSNFESTDDEELRPRRRKKRIYDSQSDGAESDEDKDMECPELPRLPSPCSSFQSGMFFEFGGAVRRAEWLRENPVGHLKEFPRLFDTPGMVELDFRAIFPDVSDKVCMLWTPVYAGEVLKYATLQGGNWQTYLNVKESTLTSDGKKVNVSLGLLPCILPPGRKAKKRASVDESLASYIDVKPEPYTRDIAMSENSSISSDEENESEFLTPTKRNLRKPNRVLNCPPPVTVAHLAAA
ncbi:uncharacterized protein LOC117125459 [Anneissia japonica]|uniref:uncharacterized protein LOC117125459 n=1 Tax=Anneissia japonica TaxID=1529436 RepID=UPI00142580E3|nr:uncharacterized protein LOC117125459 [Anneissia japonica]